MERVFPNEFSHWRMISAILMEDSEGWKYDKSLFENGEQLKYYLDIERICN